MPRSTCPAGARPSPKIPVGPSYQVPLAKVVKQAVSMPVIAVGLITDPHQAESILQDGDADAIAIARGVLWDPRWPWHAAAALGASVDAPPQHLRSELHEAGRILKEMGPTKSTPRG